MKSYSDDIVSTDRLQELAEDNVHLNTKTIQRINLNTGLLAVILVLQLYSLFGPQAINGILKGVALVTSLF